MNNTRVSYSFGTVTTYIDETNLPNTGDDPIKYSMDFVTPSGTLDYVKSSVGGSFFGLVSYGGGYTPTSNYNLVYKSWVEGYVAQELADLIAEGGGLGADDIRALFSSSVSTPLTYDNLTGIFTLDKNLSAYTNDTGFLTSLDIPVETDPIFTAWDKSTGISITESQISDFGTYLTVESDPVFTSSPAYGITNTNISNWNTAYGWGNHSGLYDLVNTASGLLNTHNSTYNHTLIATALQNITGESIYDLPEMPDLGTSKQVLRVNTGVTGLEFASLLHSDLGTILGNGAYHLSAGEVARVTTAASTTTDGYLTQTDWNTFNNKLDNFTPGNLLSFTGTTLNVDSTVLPVDDDATALTSTWSSSKIQSVIDGSSEESLTIVYTLRLNSGATVAQRLVGLVEGTDYPTGWILSADTAALVITHNLDILATTVKVFSKNGTTSDVVELQGNLAYSTFTNKYGTGYNAIRLDALATITTELYIKILI